ncbi:MAG: SurA N-terminal domain-containing protein [Nocardioidaceae bacterium]
MFRRPLRLTVAGVLVAGVLAVAGCGPVQMGAAAIVGGQRISTEGLQQTVHDTLDAAEASHLQVRDQASLQRGELTRKIDSVLIELAAKRRGITVSSGQVDRFISMQGGRRSLEAQRLRSGVPPEELRQDIRTQIMQQHLADQMASGGETARQQKAVVTTIQKLARETGVRVSPRYGRFDTDKLAVVPVKNTLSTPDDGP